MDVIRAAGPARRGEARPRQDYCVMPAARMVLCGGDLVALRAMKYNVWR